MNTATHQRIAPQHPAAAVGTTAPTSFTPLGQEQRTHVDTETAAFHLIRRPQTLRAWACFQTYPPALKPARISGRLAWPVAGLRTVLGLEP